MLRFDIKITVPHPKTRLIKQDEIIDFSKFYEDEDFFNDEEVSTGGNYPPTVTGAYFAHFSSFSDYINDIQSLSI